MPRRLFRPASRRNPFLSAVRRLVAILLAVITLWCGPLLPAMGHEGDDHRGPPASAVIPALPRLAAQSELYELVAVLEGDHLTIYLDRFEDNAPVSGANITVSIDGAPVTAEATGNETYVVASKLFGGRTSVELVFDIRSPLGDDLLIGRLALPQVALTPERASTTWYERLSAALRHGAQDHLTLLILSLLVGAGLGIALRGRRRSARLALMLPTVLIAATALGGMAKAQSKGPNGGDVVVMEGHPIEFVSKDKEIIFYILDEDGKTPVQTTGLQGRAVVQDAGKTTTVTLAPAEPNKFVGQLQAPLGAKARVVFSAKVAGHNLQARFVAN